jgi:LysM repeat protein
MKLRDTVILVVLAHVGLVLIWICMGGCADDKPQEGKEKLAVVSSESPGAGLAPVEPEVLSVESPMSIEPGTMDTAPEIVLPEIGRTTPGPAEPETATAESPRETTITVKKGDTLWGLSRRYHVPISAIVDRNDIQDQNMIREGRKLIIPVGTAPVETSRPGSELPAVPAGEPSAALIGGTEALPVVSEEGMVLHKVEPGDTIWVLARRYGSSAATIMEVNNIADPTRLQIGQELRIPKGR